MPKAKSARKVSSGKTGKTTGKKSSSETEINEEAVTPSDTPTGKKSKIAKPDDASEADTSPAKGPRKRNAPKSRAKESPESPAKSKALTEEEVDELVSDDEIEWEVERILDVRNLRGGQKEFRVKWKGFPISKATWEPQENLTACEELLTAFMESMEKEDLSRNRRLSTIHSTKSSKSLKPNTGSKSTELLARMKTGRISKNKTPVNGEASDADKQKRRNNTPTVNKDRNISVDKLVEQIIDQTKYKQKHSGLRRSAERRSVSESQKFRAPTKKSNWSAVGRSLGYCGAAIASVGVGLGTLLYASPDLVTWVEFRPQLENFVNSVRQNLPYNNGP